MSSFTVSYALMLLMDVKVNRPTISTLFLRCQMSLWGTQRGSMCLWLGGMKSILGDEQCILELVVLFCKMPFLTSEHSSVAPLFPYFQHRLADTSAI